jgi:hypothetical protein
MHPSPPHASAAASPLDLTESEALLVRSSRKRSVAVAVTGLIVLLSSWTTWIGSVAGIIAGITGIVVYQRSRDGHSVYHGRNSICCCCSTPWSQLDACGSAQISAAAFAIVCIIVNLVLLFSEFDSGSLEAVVAIINSLACVALAVACAIGTSTTRKLIRDVYIRIDNDVRALSPPSDVTVGVVLPPPNAGAAATTTTSTAAPSYGHHHQPQVYQAHASPNEGAYGYQGPPQAHQYEHQPPRPGYGPHPTYQPAGHYGQPGSPVYHGDNSRLHTAGGNAQYSNNHHTGAPGLYGGGAAQGHDSSVYGSGGQGVDHHQAYPPKEV